MIDKDLKNKPVQRVPKTDVIRTEVSSPDWAAAIGRRLVAPYPARILEAVLASELLDRTNPQSQQSDRLARRTVTMVQADAGSLEAVCRLAVENSLSTMPGLLLVIAPGLQASQRHGLRCSGVAAIFGSFIELEAIETIVTNYFESSSKPDWSLEQQIVSSI